MNTQVPSNRDLRPRFRSQSFLQTAIFLLSGLCFPAMAGDGYDMAFSNGALYTLASDKPWAEALVVDDGRIVYVGSNKGAAPFISQSEQHIDLQGKMLLPSFQDVHIHPVSGGMAYTGCPLFDLPTVEAVLDKVAACAEEQPEADYIHGNGWDWGIFSDHQSPDKKLLDAIDDKRPIVIVDADGHTFWLNSAALQLAGISAASKNPEGGEIGRREGSNEPDGTLLEGPAMELINNKLPAITDKQRANGLRYTQKYLHSLGITAIHDAYVRLQGNEADRSLPVYQQLRDTGELNLRVVAALYWEPGQGLEQIEQMERARQQYSGGRLQVGGVKFWADGIVETRTAKMLEDYSDKPGHSGLLMVPLDEMLAAVPKLDARGFQIHIHAIGDATVRYALDAFAQARAENGVRDSRFLTAHTQIVNPADIERFGKLDAIGGFSPYWAYADTYVTEINPPQLGPERMQQMYPMRSILESGGRIAFGSDWSVSTANPLLGIEAAVTHLEPDGPTTPEFMPQERLSLAQAIAGYTIDAAYANFLDTDTGSLEVGKYADLVILDTNLFDLEPADISQARVLATLIEGKLVYGKL